MFSSTGQTMIIQIRSINSVIDEFQNGKYHEDENFIIPPDLFGNT